jgi:geranylgeranyl reductase family protein
VIWDVVVVGAGPAGAAAAIGALGVRPTLRVALLDRSDFPRDKACGDGVAPHVIDLLEDAGVAGVADDRIPVPRLRFHRGSLTIEDRMARSSWVIPRTVFDHRLVVAAERAGATVVRHRVRQVSLRDPTGVDGAYPARVLVGADGAHSVVRGAMGLRPGPMAVALRGYAPTPPHRAGAQVIAFDTVRPPAYAWSFDRGDGLANVGYGAFLGREPLTKAHLRARLQALLPGAGDGGTGWRAHHLPLSSGRWRPPRGPVLLAGDAAGLVNPMTGEGIYYAVATGLAAGRAAAEAVAAADPASAGTRYAAQTRPLLATHLRHVRLAAGLSAHGAVVDAGLRASARDRRVFDDLVELGLARGRLTAAVTAGLVRELTVAALPARVPAARTDRSTDTPTDTSPDPDKERAVCES